MIMIVNGTTLPKHLPKNLVYELMENSQIGCNGGDAVG